MEVTTSTWIVALLGLLLIGLLAALQLVAVLRPRGEWIIENAYGGDPSATDPEAYFAFNQGYAWADPFFWAPLQIAGSIGMLLGQRWGFLLGLTASVPFWYTAITIFVWDRALGFRRNTVWRTATVSPWRFTNPSTLTMESTPFIPAESPPWRRLGHRSSNVRENHHLPHQSSGSM